MPARIRKVSLTDSWKAKIRASMLINRLQNHALGKNDMSSTQIKAADIVLRKVAPDVSSVQHSGEGGGPVLQKIEWLIRDAS